MPALLRYTIFLLLLFSCVAIFGQQSVVNEDALSLIDAGKSAFEDGNYAAAQKYFISALKRYPDLESKMPRLKLLLGITAYYSGDLETAKAYLSLFKNEDIAKVFLSHINQQPLNTNNIVNIIKKGRSISIPLPSEVKGQGRLKVLFVYLLSFSLYFSLFGFLEWRRNLFTNLYLRVQHIFFERKAPPPQERVPTEEVSEPVPAQPPEEEVGSFKEEVDFSTLLGEEVSQLADILEGEEKEESAKEEKEEKHIEKQFLEEDIKQLASKPSEEVKEDEGTSTSSEPSAPDGTEENNKEVSPEEEVLSNIQQTVEEVKKDINENSQVEEYIGLDENTQLQYLVDKYEGKEKYEQEDVDEIVKVLKDIEEGVDKTE